MFTRSSILFFPGFIFCAWLLVLTLRLIPLGGEWGDIDGFTWAIIFVWMVVYFSAMIIGILNVSKAKNIKPLANNISKSICWVSRLSVLATIGALLIAYEFAITRGYGFSTSVASIRVMEVNAARNGFAGSWVSGIGRLLTPALLTAWVLAILNWKQLKTSRKLLLWVASLAVFIQQVMYEGGRFYFAALLVMAFVASKFSKDSVPATKLNFNYKLICWGILLILVSIGFGFVFVTRYRDSGRDFYEVYTTWVGVFDLELDDAELSPRLTGDMASLWLGLIMLWAYVTQGFNELNVLLLFELNHKAWGLFQFSHIGHVLGKLIDSQLQFSSFESLPHAGTYFTLYGASYVDFGHIGALIFMGFIGWLTGRSIKSLRNGSRSGLALNAPLLITLGIFAPIVSLVTNLWPAFVWAFVINFFRFRIIQIPTTASYLKNVVK